MPLYRYRVVHTGIAGTPYLSTFYANEGSGSAQAFASAVGAFWTSTAAQRVTGLASNGETAVDILDTATGQLIGSAAVTDFVANGSAPAAMAPPATQGLLRLNTGAIVAGRRLEGKIYLPGVPASVITGAGGTAATYRTAYEGAAATLEGATGVEWMVWSRKAGNAVAVDGAQVWAQFAVLRSRRD